MATKKVAELKAEYTAVKAKAAFLTDTVGLTSISSVTSHLLTESSNVDTGEEKIIYWYYYKGRCFYTNEHAAKEARNDEIRENIKKIQKRIEAIQRCIDELNEIESGCTQSLSELNQDKGSLEMFKGFFQEVQGETSDAERIFNSAVDSNNAAIGCTPDGSVGEARKGFSQMTSFYSNSPDIERSANELQELIQNCEKVKKRSF